MKSEISDTQDNSCITPIKWCLTGIIIFLPFQRMVSKSIKFFWESQLSDYIVLFINSLDELIIGIFIPLSIFEYYRRRECPDHIQLILLLPIIFLSAVGLISGAVNGNSIIATLLGTIDYIKNFLVIFIYAAFFRKFAEFKKIFRILLIITAIIGFVALIQECWALSARYLLGIDLNGQASFLLSSFQISEGSWRFGLFRTTSLMHNSNSMGLYCLLIVSIYMHIVKNVRFPIILFLFSGVFLSLSRMAYAGFMFFAGIQMLKGRKWLIVVLIPFIALFLYMVSLKDFDVLEKINISDITESEMIELDNGKEVAYREYTKDKALEIWKDYPFLGAGPGMYGGIISIKTHSYYYQLYNFIAKSLLNKYSGIDQFFPQLLAEIGIFGIAIYAALFLSIFIVFLMARRRTSLIEMKGLFEGLSMFIVVILIYSLGSGLNITSVIFTYCAFAGMGLGCVINE